MTLASMKPQRRSPPPPVPVSQQLPRRWNTILEIAVSLGLAGGAIYVMLHWAIGAAVHNRPEVMVPDLTKQPVTAALALLKPLNLSLQEEGEEFHPTLPAGVVLRQTPHAGLMVREGKAVRVVISQGGQTLFVPDVVGRPLRAAEIVFRQTGFGLGEVAARPSLRFGRELVMAQEPSAGGVIDKGALINLTVSAGPPPPGMVLVPEFVGKTVEEAEGWAKDHQLPVQIIEVAQSAAPPDRIVTQLPLPDAIVPSPGSGPSLPALQLTVNRVHPTVPTGPRVYFEVPQGGSDREVRMVVTDQQGEREVYRQRHSPGSKIDLPVTLKGSGKARIFLDNTPVEEKPL